LGGGRQAELVICDQPIDLEHLPVAAGAALLLDLARVGQRLARLGGPIERALADQRESLFGPRDQQPS
jgi:hypothetical protein